MKEQHSRAVIFLLAAILCVMLFGASSVLTGFGWLATIGAILGVVFLIVAGMAKFFGSLRDEVVLAKTESFR